MAPEEELDFSNISLADWVFRQLRIHAETGAVAQIFADDGTLKTYADLHRDAVHVAAGLSSMGVHSGDVLSIVTRNSHNVFSLALGCIMADVLIVASVADLPAYDLRKNILLVPPKVILTRKSNLMVVKQAIEGAEFSQKPEVYDIDDFFTETVSKGAKTDIKSFSPVKIEDPQNHGFLCLFSSGTTGSQKAVLSTDFGYLRGAHFVSPFARIYTGPIFSTTQPFWATWWNIVLRALSHGRVRVFVDTIDPIVIANAIHKYKPSTWYGSITGIPPVQRALKENPGKWDFSSLNVIFATGNVLDAGLQKNFEETFKKKVLSEYGSTETGVQFVLSLDEPVVPASVGKPASVFKVKLVDSETGKEITEPFKPGELLTKSTQMKCYVNAEKATKEAFDEDGWFKTGDILYFDNDGNYFMVERVKEMFKYRGYQIAPSDLESIIRNVPGVAEVVVVGKRGDTTIGHLPAAFIVKEKNATVSEQDVHDFLEKVNVHDAKKLRGGVFFIDEIPKNANGKVIRRKLQDIVNGVKTG